MSPLKPHRNGRIEKIILGGSRKIAFLHSRVINGGRLVELRRDCAVFDRSAQPGSQRNFDRRAIDVPSLSLPWAERAPV
jgi:hypothetical protein